MISDKKKVQAMINVCVEGIQNCRQEVAHVKSKLALYDAHDPSIDNTGTPFAGGADVAYRTKLTELETLLNDPMMDALITLYVPGHGTKAIEAQ